MNQYTYFCLGIVLGLSIAIYFFVSREERIEKSIKVNQKIFSTEKLNNIMEIVIDRIEYKIKEVKRELTEEEKDEIIKQCCRENSIFNE